MEKRKNKTFFMEGESPTLILLLKKEMTSTEIHWITYNSVYINWIMRLIKFFNGEHFLIKVEANSYSYD